jgi:membrane protein involved in colicin uptake
MQTPRLERTASEEAAARAAREKEAVREAKRAALEEKRAARAARKAEREAAREARARAAGKDPRHDDDRDEVDDTLLLEGEPDDPETAMDGDDEKAEGGKRRQAVRVVHEPTPGGDADEPRR